ncbi:hypothetical protein ACQGFI_13025 [Rhodococcus sp. 2.95]
MSVLPGSNSGAASEATFALTGAQLGIWNAQRLDPESRSYLVGEVLEISGDEPIDTELLTAAITATIGEAGNHAAADDRDGGRPASVHLRRAGWHHPDHRRP